MKITQVGLGTAICVGMGITKEVDTLLIGEQDPGTWVLVFLNSAREVLSDEDADKITKAMSSLIAIPNVSDEESHQLWLAQYFSDLTDRIIKKPETLINLTAVQQTDNITADE